MNDFETARQKYKPDNIKVLFIAESPPSEDSGRFFYFEHVKSGDSLFLEMMKHLYPQVKEYSPKVLREGKAILLKQFKEDGYYLIDAVPYSVSGLSPRDKKEAIYKEKEILQRKIKGLVNSNTKVVLISATVFNVLYEYLKNSEFNVIHHEIIPFGGFGQQKIFHSQLEKFGI